jgi:hypothetical protein
MKLNLVLFLLATLANTATGETDPVDLNTAGNYVILAKSGISTVPNSNITGNIGVSPIAAAAMTGFSLALDSEGQYSTSSQLTGEAHAASYGSSIEAVLTKAVLDMQAAYTDAAGRTPDPSNDRGVNFLNGLIGGRTLTPGVYTFTMGVTIASDLSFDGGPDDVWIISTMGDLNLATNMDIVLKGSAQAKNIFWRVAGKVVIGADALMAGILLVQTDVLFTTGSSLNGRVYAQTAVNLQMATIMNDGDVFC